MLWKWGSEPFESRVRLALFGILLAALLMQVTTVLLVGRLRSAMESQLLGPLYETLDEMEIRASDHALPPHEMWQRRRGLELRRKFYLRDTTLAAVAAVWGRIPPAARQRLAAGHTARMHLWVEGGYEVRLARLVDREEDAQLLSVGRTLPEYSQLITMDRWNTGVRTISLLLLLVAIFLLARELTRPFRRLRRVTALAQLNLAWRGKPSRDQWEEIIETFTAAIDRLKADEAKLHRQYLSSEQERQRLDHLNSCIIDAIPAGLVAADGDGRIVQANRAAYGLPGLGVPRSGTAVGAFFAPWAHLAKQLNLPSDGLGSRPESELEVLHGGERFHFAYHLINVADGSTLVLLDDRTQLRRLEALLAQRARLAALGETAAGLAHELRNAMGAIVGYAKLLRRIGDAGARELTVRIEAEAADMEALLNRFLEVARPAELKTRDVVGEELVEEIAARFEPRFNAHSISLVRSLGGPTRVVLDPFWFQRALGNLLENALHASSHGGAVRITTSCSTDGWRVRVADSGPGVRPELREKIFAPFVSFHTGGTGLGLALVQKVMTAHEGRAEVSEASGGGAEFALVFPVSQVQAIVKQSVVTS
jgi:two-component system sensor histidine kinase FlrB